MIDLRVDADLSELGTLALRFPRLVQTEVGRALHECCLTLVRTIKIAMPATSGRMRASVSWAVDLNVARGDMVGRVFSQVPYAQAFEEGVKPGSWPPPAALEEWAEHKAKRHAFIRKMGPKRFAFIVGRQIKKRGVQGHHIFRKAFESAQAYIHGRFSAAVTRIVRRANGGG